jgi:hypothetical protein
MKTTCLCFFFLMGTCAPIHAQLTSPQTSANVGDAPIRQGRWLVGGSIGSTGYNFSTKTFQFNVDPKLGYFFRDNIAIGGQGTIGLSFYKGGSTVNYGVAPFIRYYFPETATRTGRWFGEGSLGINGSHKKNSEEDLPVSLMLGLRGGYAHFIARNVAIEGTLGYTFTRADISSSSGDSGLGLAFGFQIYLPGKIK